MAAAIGSVSGDVGGGESAGGDGSSDENLMQFRPLQRKKQSVNEKLSTATGPPMKLEPDGSFQQRAPDAKKVKSVLKHTGSYCIKWELFKRRLRARRISFSVVYFPPTTKNKEPSLLFTDYRSLPFYNWNPLLARPTQGPALQTAADCPTLTSSAAGGAARRGGVRHLVEKQGSLLAGEGVVW
ncbi:uncharacterized protein PITG_18418 [Phytophthora infestans T30-4]|uniref:Uncharacterized protein n=1 Tax=Phytophthora infestans (strain T30-4) TaxID=403677 RepID=D0NWZ5_PHYIT|nr:uncharacterized protein PITG_18418 [Phytophthora infestans T30-4]EEY67587.1 conserved hypothetical protein [Phytophthora infestans T30-4]|eukprot:XP_002896352.1 conserved hypothetical protein [Phytophthora infestans T30-4]